MVELLVKAKPHWMDNLKQSDVDKMLSGEKLSYNARSQIGDIIVVRPNGWKWGKEECLPNYVVIKIPDLKIEDAKKYEESLQEEYTNSETQGPETRMLKRRKYQISKVVVENAKQLSKDSISVSSLDKDTFISNIIHKDK